MPAVVKLHIRRVHALEREVLVIGRRCVAGEERSARGVRRYFDESIGHGVGIAYRRGQAAVSVPDDLGHAPDIGDDSGHANGHGLQERHGKTLGGGGHAVDIGRGEEACNVETLPPEGDAILHSKFANEGFELRPFGSIAYDPEPEIFEARRGVSDGADQRGEVFDGSKAADEQERQAGLLRPVFDRGRHDRIDAVVDAHDALAQSARGVPQVFAGGVTDANDPVAEPGYEVDRDLLSSPVRRSDETMARNDDGAGSGKTRGNDSLQGRRRIVTVHHLRPHAAKLVEKAQEGFRQRSFAKDQHRDSLAKKLFAKGAEVAVSDDRDVVSVLSLKAAELSDEDLRSAHFKTVDDVNDFHARRWLESGFKTDRKPLSNFHDTSCCANSWCRDGDILRELPVTVHWSYCKSSFSKRRGSYE